MRVIETEKLDNEAIQSLSQNERDWVYNGLDCCLTFAVFNEIHPQLGKETAVTYDIESQLVGPILDMTLRGCLISPTKRQQAISEINQIVLRLEKNLNRILIDGLGYKKVNPQSPKQLLDLVYGVLQLPVKKKRKSNGSYGPSTDRDTLETLAATHIYASVIINHILAIRDWRKQLSLIKTPLDKDGRIRASYNIAGTNTGRLASSKSSMGTGTNLQNINKKVKYQFIPDKGKRMANVDLEQADSRNVGAICWNLLVDEHGPEYAGSYLDACESGDLHTYVCRMAWPDLPWSDDPKEWRATADLICYRNMTYRDMAKRLGHGTNFLGTPRTMAGHTKVPTKQIAEFQKNYFAAFPCLIAWHEDIIKALHANRQIITLWDRKRTFFKDPANKANHREATAYSPQSSTADEINLGMIVLWCDVPEAEILLQVHDSLAFQYPAEIENDLIPRALAAIEVKQTLKQNREFSVPVDCTVGWNWGDQKSSNPDGQIGWHPGLVDDRPMPVENYEEKSTKAVLENRFKELWAKN